MVMVNEVEISTENVDKMGNIAVVSLSSGLVSQLSPIIASPSVLM
jgi:succinyl-CoA synthetase alpha subunit